MQLEDYLDFQGPDVIRLKGHRIGLEHLVERYHDGFSPEQIAQEFPGLSLEQIYGTMAYYLHNKAEVDAYIARINKAVEECYQEWLANSSPLSRRLHALKAQREQERKQQHS
jgi:uncharacterized protein (DUF433 family)